MTVTLELTSDLSEKLHEMAQGRVSDAQAIAKELLAQMPPTKNGAASAPAAVLPRREGGFLRGAFTMRADFDDPLPDSFWLGEE